ncbi:hypothetical protein TCAL_14378 [Tigriopus californicus]|uniref:BZIP domain-containing protein n=2 Tax=Tigriopus californicus TaxID=6832 RepID=A0A553PKW3_TIGCA|nr:hypothetical protein TCAL_14378 [Tigriopus californicus]
MVPENNGTIIEDDQQLYDWGIENQLDQYYHGNSGAGHGPQHNSSVLHGVPESELPHPSYPEQSSGPGYLSTHSHDFQQRYTNMPPHPSYQDTHSMSNCHAPPYSPGQDTVSSGQMDGDSDIKAGIFSQTKVGRTMMPRVDMDANEVLKVERKRARNRLAASKCRMRKLERIAVLDDQARQLREENEKLASFSDKLRAQIYELKQELRWHVNNGCKLVNSGSKALADVASPDSTTSHLKHHPTSQIIKSDGRPTQALLTEKPKIKTEWSEVS